MFERKLILTKIKVRRQIIKLWKNLSLLKVSERKLCKLKNNLTLYFQKLIHSEFRSKIQNLQVVRNLVHCVLPLLLMKSNEEAPVLAVEKICRKADKVFCGQTRYFLRTVTAHDQLHILNRKNNIRINWRLIC